jgi:hypothetical protein
MPVLDTRETTVLYCGDWRELGRILDERRRAG